jgi:hypothetical protein
MVIAWTAKYHKAFNDSKFIQSDRIIVFTDRTDIAAIGIILAGAPHSLQQSYYLIQT